jgi:hypothetical protein
VRPRVNLVKAALGTGALGYVRPALDRDRLRQHIERRRHTARDDVGRESECYTFATLALRTRLSFEPEKCRNSLRTSKIRLVPAGESNPRRSGTPCSYRRGFGFRRTPDVMLRSYSVRVKAVNAVEPWSSGQPATCSVIRMTACGDSQSSR